MSDLYAETHRRLQSEFDSERLADSLEKRIVNPQLQENEARFVAAADMFFLTTIDRRGFPTVSYKGGTPGFVRVLDPANLAFPIYDGNGMFYTAGNMGLNTKIGLLFIDFVNPRRLRIHGTASVDMHDPLLDTYKEAQLVVRVAIEDAFVNCARYIHRHERLGYSDHAPREDHETAIAAWKTVELMDPLLSKKDRLRPGPEDKRVTREEYQKEFWQGLDD